MMKSYVLILYASLLAASSAKNLPSYVKACSRNDPDFFKCGVKNGNEAIPRITEGDPEYGFPVLDPLKDEEVQHFVHPKLNLTISEITLHGLKHAKLVSFAVDGGTHSVFVFVNHLKGIFKYSLSGQVLEHDIKGSGVTELEFYNVTIPIDVVLKQTTDKTYLAVDNVKAQLLPEKVTFKTLHFNGDQETLKRAEHSANENWQKLMTVLSPILDKLLSSAAYKLSLAFVNNVPAHLIFLR